MVNCDRSNAPQEVGKRTAGFLGKKKLRRKKENERDKIKDAPQRFHKKYERSERGSNTIILLLVYTCISK